MYYETLDNEELLYVALDAINIGRHGEAIALLRRLMELEPGNANSRYLLAAQHAQLGMLERAEQGFRSLLAGHPEFSMARFQLGQLLLLRNAAADAKEVLAPLAPGEDALAAYARALCALNDDHHSAALHELETGLELPQPAPSLAIDMRNLQLHLKQRLNAAPPRPTPVDDSISVSSPPIFMTNYGRGD